MARARDKDGELQNTEPSWKNWNLSSVNRKPRRPREKLEGDYRKGFEGHRIQLG